MSNLPETFSFKVSREMKDFLDTTDNASEYVRDLIRQSMRIRNKVDTISSLETIDGEQFFVYDEDSINELLEQEVIKTVIFHTFRETDIALKRKNDG